MDIRKRYIILVIILVLSTAISVVACKSTSEKKNVENEVVKDTINNKLALADTDKEKETTTDVYVYDMVGDDKTIVLPTEDIIKICIQTPESQLEEYYTVSDSTKIKDLVNGIKKMTFIKGDTKNLATGSSMVVDLYYSEKNYMRISVLGKQAFIITDDKAGYFETNDYSMLEALVNAAI